MYKWAAILLSLAAACGCLGAMGVGATMLGWLALCLALMIAIAWLIARPFLRRRTWS